MIVDKDELNIYEVEAIHQELLQEFEGNAVLIDMKNVNKIDMSVIQLLVSTKKSCLDNSKNFELQNVTPEVLNILKNSACDSFLGLKHE